MEYLGISSITTVLKNSLKIGIKAEDLSKLLYQQTGIKITIFLKIMIF